MKCGLIKGLVVSVNRYLFKLFKGWVPTNITPLVYSYTQECHTLPKLFD